MALLAAEFRGRACDMQELAQESVRMMHMVLKATEAKMAPGVYFLQDKSGRVVYVGQSENVLLRMAGHKNKEFSGVKMIRVDRQTDRDDLEQKFIHLLLPPINAALTGFNNAKRLLEMELREFPHAVAVAIGSGEE